MTESDWFQNDLQSMLAHAPCCAGSHSEEQVDRRLRLFASACCRKIWNHIGDLQYHGTLELCENNADMQSNQKRQLEANSLWQWAFQNTRELVGPIFTSPHSGRAINEYTLGHDQHEPGAKIALGDRV